MSAPTRTQTPIGDALDHIAVEEVLWVRLAAVRQADGELNACLLEVVSGAPPPGWEPAIWEYPEVIFSAFHQSGSQMADCLREGNDPGRRSYSSPSGAADTRPVGAPSERPCRDLSTPGVALRGSTTSIGRLASE